VFNKKSKTIFRVDSRKEIIRKIKHNKWTFDKKGLNTTAYRTWGGTSGKFRHWISPKNYGSAAPFFWDEQLANKSSQTIDKWGAKIIIIPEQSEKFHFAWGFCYFPFFYVTNCPRFW